ncbi:hypothetical protein VP01_2396g1 [Puccinia sorghi]|uniref:Uncharacterized protein n=1 Tax=Puccinia sorghi TaxID=27349 RepID=A0A0L6V6U4_9BASI|nr:hypothetical protein VP01_2396g1 [Puccinia sorghi]
MTSFHPAAGGSRRTSKNAKGRYLFFARRTRQSDFLSTTSNLSLLGTSTPPGAPEVNVPRGSAPGCLSPSPTHASREERARKDLPSARRFAPLPTPRHKGHVVKFALRPCPLCLSNIPDRVTPRISLYNPPPRPSVPTGQATSTLDLNFKDILLKGYRLDQALGLSPAPPPTPRDANQPPAMKPPKPAYDTLPLPPIPKPLSSQSPNQRIMLLLEMLLDEIKEVIDALGDLPLDDEIPQDHHPT